MTLAVDWLTKAFFDEIQTWARETFPDQTPERVMAHLVEEHHELRYKLEKIALPESIGEEIADNMILLVVLADTLGIDVLNAMKQKHAKNRERTPRFHPELGYDKMDG